MKKLCMVIFLVLLLTACGSNIQPEENYAEIFSLALDTIFKQNENLNDNIEYIAIDMSNMDDLSAGDKEEILHFFHNKYEIDTIAATLKELKEQGLYSPETGALHGILLILDEVDITSNDTIQLIGSKYRSGIGGVGVEIRINYQGNDWRVIDNQVIWNS